MLIRLVTCHQHVTRQNLHKLGSIFCKFEPQIIEFVELNYLLPIFLIITVFLEIEIAQFTECVDHTSVNIFCNYDIFHNNIYAFKKSVTEQLIST